MEKTVAIDKIELFFVNKETGKRFKVLRHDKARNVVLLKGEYTEFEEPYDRERIEKLGYKLEKVLTPEKV